MMAEQREDEILGKAYDSKLMKRLLIYIKPYKMYVIAAILFNILVAGLGPLRPYLSKGGYFFIKWTGYFVSAFFHSIWII